MKLWPLAPVHYYQEVQMDNGSELYPEHEGRNDVLVCLDAGDGCEGNVEYRMPLSGTGRSFPRCDHHWEERLVKHAADIERHGNPESPVAPEWFDETAIGERWNEDY